MKARSCPYLGLEYDPSTYQAFPSGENFCHKARVPGPVDQQYQATVCLTDAYPGCPIFAGEGAALGSAGRAPALPRLSRKAFLFLLAGAVVVGLSLLALLLPGAKNIGAFFSSPTDSPFPPTVTQTRIVVVEGQVTPTPENLSLPLIWRQPTGTPLPTATSTQTPTVTLTPEPTRTPRPRATQSLRLPQPTARPTRPPNTSQPVFPTPPPFRPTANP